MIIKPERVYKPTIKETTGKVIYWMSREQRSVDNWGLLYAQDLCDQFSTEMAVVFCLADQFLDATERQYAFMIGGLTEVARGLRNKNIPFYLLTGDPVKQMNKFLIKHKVGHVITDFDPLRIKQQWIQRVIQTNNGCFYEVDSHNIVPARYITDKLEFGAYTLRPKIQKKLDYFLDEFPDLGYQKDLSEFRHQEINWEEAFNSLQINRDVKPVGWIKPGQTAAIDTLDIFFRDKIMNYSSRKNDPNKDVLSNLSPYLHFGQISAQRIALNLLKTSDNNENIHSFLEELIVRKELSDNYCLHNSEYDTLENIPEWAKKTLHEHRKDEREFLYSRNEFEYARTHEALWNAAQNELINTGKMHGYMRMYWAKKILEWSKSPEEAMQTAVYLNDKYELDGRDPNGYTGCAWAIAGVHDRAWKERPVYGKIRYMNYNGAVRKFDVNTYINKWNSNNKF